MPSQTEGHRLRRPQITICSALSSSIGNWALDSTDTPQAPNNTNEDYCSTNIIETAATDTTPASSTATATAVGNQINDGRGNFSVTVSEHRESLRHHTSGSGSGDLQNIYDGCALRKMPRILPRLLAVEDREFQRLGT